MLSQLRSAAVMVGTMTALLGIAYPLAMTGIAQTIMPAQANGSLIVQGGVVVGSGLIGQSFTRPEYLNSRPSATEPAYNAAASTGSNLGPSSAELLASVRARAGVAGPLPVPSEMATASASGLDPHITLAAARAQVPRIAAARGVAAEAVEAAINGATSRPAFGFVGQPIVNVLRANLALDAAKG